MENLDLGRGLGQNFDHLTMVILKCQPWSWSKIFDHMTMTWTPRRRPNGQKNCGRLTPSKLGKLALKWSHCKSVVFLLHWLVKIDLLL